MKAKLLIGLSMAAFVALFAWVFVLSREVRSFSKIGMATAITEGDAGHRLGSLPTNGGGGVSPGTAGQVFVTNSGPAAAFTSLIQYETTHGRFSAGGGGSDTTATIGPLVTAETAAACLWLLPNGTAPSGSNYEIYGDGTSSYFNAGSLAHVSIGGTNYLNINSTVAAFGVSGSALNLDYTMATTPLIQSGIGATSLTMGTNKAGATFSIQGNAATTYVSYGGATGQGEIFAAAAPTIAATGNTALSAAQAADPVIKLGSVSLTGNVTVTFPNAQGFWIVDASGITLNAHTLQFVSGSTTAAAVTPSTTNQLFFVSTYGSNTISVK